MTKKTIGLGHEKDSLYFLDFNTLVVSPIKKRESASPSNELLQWHHRLSHPSFSLLHKIFPQSIFPASSLHREPFQLAKHCHSVYLISDNRNLSFFPL